MTSCIVDYCACGTPGRARARLLFWGTLPPTGLVLLRCTGRGVCSWSQRPQLQLTGTKDGAFLTKKKNAYPDRLCAILAKGFDKVHTEKQACNVWKDMKPTGFSQRTA